MNLPWQGPDPETLETAASEIAESVGDHAQRELRLASLVAWSKGQYQQTEKADKVWRTWIVGKCGVKLTMANRYAAAGAVLRDEACQNALSRAISASKDDARYHGTLDIQKLATLGELDALRGRFFDDHPEWNRLTRSQLRREKIVWWGKQPEASPEIRQQAGKAKRKTTLAGGEGSAEARAARLVGRASPEKLQRLAMELLDGELLALVKAAYFMPARKLELGQADPAVLDELAALTAGLHQDLQQALSERQKGSRNEPDQQSLPTGAARSDRVAAIAIASAGASAGR